ncbi:MAG: bifunctional phosphoribosylaminoimidazolecarboxamide formyltransferase/IMP cyclohydrolase [Phycisphaerales bacterium]|jgi:phosphoribosylaminoimidazolecarboxamide formyltransferase/IMP cyclohydrolase|nr:bifunctional phosphoribosylaminoimidazolecarboxamide formyltransferase/IMP cyclohydrolase [Phycisphaerales bacterium]
MPDLVPVRRALISVSDKSDVVSLARHLHECGVEIISTGGTAAALAAAGVPTTPVENVTGFPEMMDGRVKTLHPRIHGGLLGRRDLEGHVEAMRDHGIEPIDLVCINLYPFERTIANPDTTDTEAIEQIDIGGPAVLRSASKNHDFVATVTSPSQYDALISDMRANDGCTSLHLRQKLAAAAFARTAGYDAAISNWLARSTEDALPPRLHVSATRSTPLRYGENPHQQAALYVLPGTGEAGIASAETIDGKPLSYNNLNDASAAWRCCRDLARVGDGQIASVVIKHANPCGAALAPTAIEAFSAAWSGDPMAAFGGIVGVSAPVDAGLAATIVEGKRFVEVIVAPSFDPGATAMLTERWKNIRLVATPDITAPPSSAIELKSIPGGLLAQTPDIEPMRFDRWTHAAGPPPDDSLRESAIIALVAAKHAGSNAVTIAGEGRLLGLGAGQVDRLTAAKLAVEKSGEALQGAHPTLAASDAFFPFADGPELLIDAGVTCIIHPGGSKRDEDTFAICNERGVTCLLTGTRHFKH